MTEAEHLDVVIVGAGLSGLTAAVCLQSAGLRLCVLEGAAQIGGRILAVPDSVTGEPIADLGPTWVWPRWQPVVSRWMDRLGLATFAQYDDGDGLLDGFGGPLRRHPIPGQDGIARIKGGPSAIIQALAAQLRPGSIVTDAKVVEIQTDGSQIQVITAQGRRVHAAQAILATPLRVTAEQIRIQAMPPAVDAAMRATPTWMAQQAKVVALYPTPFWRDTGLSGRVASRTGPLVEVHDHTPASGGIGALFGFVGWDAATRAANPDELRRAILDQLERCFGPDGAHPTQLILQDWAHAPLICSDTDLRMPPVHPDVGPASLRQGHFGNRLWFAASETANLSPGLIEGAFAAGETAARNVVAHWDRGAPPPD
jgi:monoamine oxidase